MSEQAGKVKTRRDDFVVDEISNFTYQKTKPPARANRPGNRNASSASRSPSAGNQAGPHAVYRLSKSGIGTVEACEQVVRTWDLPRKSLSYAGRKDRHAHTTQLVTLCDGPDCDFEGSNFTLTYLGQAKRPVNANDIRGNRFQITLRDLEPAEASRLAAAYEQHPPIVPNYFDEQRFGSVCTDDQFAAVPWCLGDYEKATYLALAEDNPRDSTFERKQRQILRDHWGDWQTCKDKLERGNRRSVVTYLVDHPQGFKKAAALINRDQRSLFVSALQSRLWNELVSRWMPQKFSDCPAWLTLTTLGGQLQFPGLNYQVDRQAEFDELKIPLPSARPTRWPDETQDAKPLLTEVCAGLGLTPHKLRFSHPRDVFFSRMQRSVFLDVSGWELKSEDDDLHEQRSKIKLQFQLGPGQYATMLLKALQLQ